MHVAGTFLMYVAKTWNLTSSREDRNDKMSTVCCIRFLRAAFLSVSLKDLWRSLNFIKTLHQSLCLKMTKQLSSVGISKEIGMRLVQCLSGIHVGGGGVGRGIQTSRFSCLTFPAPAPLYILAFLPIALVYRLQNTKDCRVTYPPPTFSSLPSLIPSAHILRYLASLSSLPTFPQKLILLLPGDHLHTMKFLNILFERASDPL